MKGAIVLSRVEGERCLEALRETLASVELAIEEETDLKISVRTNAYTLLSRQYRGVINKIEERIKALNGTGK
jgi:hypothetical protein